MKTLIFTLLLLISSNASSASFTGGELQELFKSKEVEKQELALGYVSGVFETLTLTKSICIGSEEITLNDILVVAIKHLERTNILLYYSAVSHLKLAYETEYSCDYEPL